MKQTDTTTSIIDDQELAKALAGMDTIPIPEEPEEEQPEEVEEEQPEKVETTPEVAPLDLDSLRGSAPSQLPNLDPVPEREDLQAVKMQAVEELRPLVDKLNLPADEKFDVYLLLIRSTDDETLIQPAHETAKLIEDDSRRAMALLDIIKETDYLSNKKNNETFDADETTGTGIEYEDAAAQPTANADFSTSAPAADTSFAQPAGFTDQSQAQNADPAPQPAQQPDFSIGPNQSFAMQPNQVVQPQAMAQPVQNQ